MDAANRLQGRRGRVPGVTITCECGARVRAASERELLAAMRFHLSAEHPRLAGVPSAADLLAMAEVDE